jgi:UDP-N-acetylglucosamine 2-epimerase
VDNLIRLRSILEGIRKANMKIFSKSSENDQHIEILKLLKHAKLVLTDSGGLQKEAFWSQTPCITLRDSTEWTETIEAGVNQIVGADAEKIVQAIRAVEEKYDEIKKKFTGNLFGYGYAARRIVKVIKSFMHITNF